MPLGLPVAAEFCRPPLDEASRRELKRELGLRGEFLVVLTGGAEGSGGLRRRAAAILRQVDNVDVAVICGRNRSLRRRVGRLAERTGDGRLTAQGFVGNMADWLRCADIVVGKAGPGTIAEATCCGAPLVLTSFVPGQEKGNAEFVTEAGAGVYAPRPRQLAAEVGRLRRDPAALAAMRDASARAGRPARPLISPASSPIWWSRRRSGRQPDQVDGWPPGGGPGRRRWRKRRLAERAAPRADGGNVRHGEAARLLADGRGGLGSPREGVFLAAPAAPLRRPHPRRAPRPVTRPVWERSGPVIGLVFHR